MRTRPNAVTAPRAAVGVRTLGVVGIVTAVAVVAAACGSDGSVRRATATSVTEATPAPTGGGATTTSTSTQGATGGAGPEINTGTVHLPAVGATFTEDSFIDRDLTALLRQPLPVDGVGPLGVHLMGWGSLNPEPAPGRYDWSSLDERVAVAAATGRPVTLTLCCAPDWMKGGAPGSTDWHRLEVRPRTDHHDDFAALAAAAVTRYPAVTRVLVWNELKGFWDDTAQAWDVADYTDLFNRVAAAVHRARPGVAVGGPYVRLDLIERPGSVELPSAVRGSWGTIDGRTLDAVAWWLAHQTGADFLAVDATVTPRDDRAHAPIPDRTDLFGAIARWARARTPLPIWFAEWYPIHDRSAEPPGRQAVHLLAALVASGRGDVAGVQLWQPRADTAAGRRCEWACLWDASVTTPLADALAWLGDGPDGVDVDTLAAPAGVVALRGTGGHLVVANGTDAPADVTVDGTVVTVAAGSVVRH